MTIINSLHILLCCQENCACRQRCLLLCRKKNIPSVFRGERGGSKKIMGAIVNALFHTFCHIWGGLNPTVCTVLYVCICVYICVLLPTLHPILLPLPAIMISFQHDSILVSLSFLFFSFYWPPSCHLHKVIMPVNNLHLTLYIKVTWCYYNTSCWIYASHQTYWYVVIAEMTQCCHLSLQS